MAVRDVKKYYYNMLNQYVAVKQDLQEFEQAFKDGLITEDKVEGVKSEVEVIEANFERLAYIMYLLEMPQRETKQKKYAKTNKQIIDSLEAAEADQDSIYNENKSALVSIRAQLEELTKK